MFPEKLCPHGWTWQEGRAQAYILVYISSFGNIQQCIGNLHREESSRDHKTVGENKRSNLLPILSHHHLSNSHQHSHGGWRQMFEYSFCFTKYFQIHLKFTLPSLPPWPSPGPQKEFLSYHSPSWNLSSALSAEKRIHYVNQVIPFPAWMLCKSFSVELER